MDAVMREKQPDIVIAHSWGTVIAYDYFTNREFDGEPPGGDAGSGQDGESAQGG